MSLPHLTLQISNESLRQQLELTLQAALPHTHPLLRSHEISLEVGVADPTGVVCLPWAIPTTLPLPHTYESLVLYRNENALWEGVRELVELSPLWALSGMPMGMKSLLPGGSSGYWAQESWCLEHSRGRQQIVDALALFAEKHCEALHIANSSQITRSLGCALEELLMNAIWDANPARTEQDRVTSFALDPKEHIHVQFATNGTYLGVEVVDPFGTFPREALQKSLHAILDPHGAMRIVDKQNNKGAGIGLSLALSKSDILSIRVKEGHWTQCLAGWRLGTAAQRKDYCRKIIRFHKAPMQ